MCHQIFFLDTNVFLECKWLEELPWQDLTEKDPIRLIIALTVIEEIGKRKNGYDRKADRARKASELLGKIRDIPEGCITVRDAGPHVSIEIAPHIFPKPSEFPELDLSQADNRIVAEAKLFAVSTPDVVSLLTRDTLPGLLARSQGVHSTPVPKEWLLPREPDAKDKQIRSSEACETRTALTYADAWQQIEALTQRTVPSYARQGCVAPKLVTIPAGRALYSAGLATKQMMEWGAYEEHDIEWYFVGNQLDPDWYVATQAERVAIYEYEVVLDNPTPAIMSKVADQPGAPPAQGPAKFQYYTPAGLGPPVRKRLLGYLHRDGLFSPTESAS
jgi:PIN domain